MPVRSAQFGLSLCGGHATMADSPRGQGRTPSTGSLGHSRVWGRGVVSRIGALGVFCRWNLGCSGFGP
eukprot:9786318-Alexandrium_andersonii.AAC.1